MFEKHWLVPLWYLLLAPYIAYFVFKIVNVSEIHFHIICCCFAIVYTIPYALKIFALLCSCLAHSPVVYTIPLCVYVLFLFAGGGELWQ